MNDQGTIAINDHPSGEILPEYWPAPEKPQPMHAVWLPWPIAVVLAPLFWLFPKRMGPHFAESRWTGAVVAHVCWVVYGIGCIANAFYYTHYSWIAYLTGQCPGQQDPSVWSPPTLSQIFRTPLAVLANELYTNTNHAQLMLVGISTILGCVLALVLLSLLLMPYAATGERNLRLFARCVKLTLWSTTSLVVLGPVLQVTELFGGNRYHRELYSMIVISAYVTWFMWIWIRSGMRYAGPVEGPGWKPRRPLCEKCGYILTGLTAKDNCPECGQPIVESLPESRQPSPFAPANNIVGRIRGFCKTFIGALMGRGFYQRLAVHDSHAVARRFAVWTSIICGPVFFFVGLSVLKLLTDDPRRYHFHSQWEFSAVFITTCVSVTVSLLILLSLIVFFIAQLRS
ncbi:MAG: hypothetical protein JSV03_07180, partial [Planctomycetota bacterium]